MAAPTHTDEQLVALLDEVWESIATLGESLTEAEWKAPTECPGWTVQDNVAHIVGIESSILGRREPELPTPTGDHLKNDVGVRNEVWVEALRDRSGADVVTEFRDVTGERLAALRSPGTDFGVDSWTPVGPGTVRDLLPFRVFDSWVHEQDMCRAIGRLPSDDPDAGELAFDRIVAVMPMVVGKRAAAPEGATVVFDVSGPIARKVVIAVEGGRAKLIDAIPSEATVRITTDTDTFVRLGTGRGQPEAILRSALVRLDGDEALGTAIVQSMNFLF